MYATPTLRPLDPATSAASCCRVIVQSGGTLIIQQTNEPLCPFPAPTPSVCVQAFGSPLVPDTSACVLAN